MSARVLASSAIALGLALAGCSAETAPQTSEDVGAMAASSPAPTSPSSAPDSPAPTAAAPAADCPTVASVTVALPSLPSPRFAGYYASRTAGYFRQDCLDVAFLNVDGPEASIAALAEGTADVAVASVPAGLSARESGAAVVNVAQVFQRSGQVEVSLTTTPIPSPADFRGQRIGLGEDGGWEVIAEASKAGLDPVADTTLVSPGNAEALLTGEVTAAATQTYDGLARLIGQPHPSTGAALTGEDLTVIDSNAQGVALYADGIWTRQDVVDGEGSAETLQRFLIAALRGWIDCRDDATACAALPDIAPDDDDLGLRMMEAVNRLVWPSPSGVGIVDPGLWSQTVNVALVTKNLDGDRLITRTPEGNPYVTRFAETALDVLSSEGHSPAG